MGSAFYNRLVAFATGRRIGVLIAACVVSGASILLAEQVMVQRAPKHPGTMPDACYFGYSPGYVREYLDRIGPPGQQLFVGTHLILDVFFPVFYAGLLVCLIVRLCPPGFARVWLWLPIAAAVADLGENVLLAYLALTFDGQPASLAQLASYFTVTKWLLIAASAVGLLLGTLVAWWRG